MSLAPGTRFGPYEVVELIGAGGMGEVYRARDTRLHRDVALKVLPPAGASSEERRRRFEREAQLVSKLSHPHICALYDVGTEGNVLFVVMELLEGQTLAVRLSSGALPLEQVARTGGEICSALEAAHAKGIVHRDLKPGNVMLTDAGAKLLDFGLAKALEDSTLVDHNETDGHTVTGAVLGTLQYMSPEQLEGRPVDARTDIFALGSVLYEMTTGRRAFSATSQASLISAILNSEPPPMSAVQPIAPPALDSLVRICLAKDPSRRWRSAHDVALQLAAIGLDRVLAHHSSLPSASDAVTFRTKVMPQPATGARRVRLLTAVALAAGSALAGVALDRMLRPSPPIAFTAIRTLTYSGHDVEPAVSPDGKTIAFCSSRDGKRRIWLKQLSTGDEIAITSGPDNAPRFSPDGTQLLFLRGVPAVERSAPDLYRVPILGGEPRRVVAKTGPAEWAPDGQHIVFVRVVDEQLRTSTRLYSILPDGGDSKELARFDGRWADVPRFSPDGKTIVLRSLPMGELSGARFELVPSDGGVARALQPPPTLGAVSNPVFSADGKTLLYAQQLFVRFGASRLLSHSLGSGETRALVLLPFEPNTLDAAAPGMLVADSAASRENLLEVPLGGDRPHRWLTRGTSNDRQPAFSRDGEWIAFSSDRSGNLDIWMVSTTTGALRRVTEHPADDWDPGFTRDGKLIWSSARSGHLEIWTAESDGSSPRRVSDDGTDAQNPTATADGWIVYAAGNPAKPGLWKIRVDGTQASRIVEGETVGLPEASPDGRTLAYADSARGPIRFARIEDGRPLPLVIPTTVARITSVPMGRVRWSADGRRVFFLAQDGDGRNGIFVQDFDTEKPDTSATRRKVAGFDADRETDSFAISPDGSRIYVAGREALDSLVTIEGVPGLHVHRPAR